MPCTWLTENCVTITSWSEMYVFGFKQRISIPLMAGKVTTMQWKAKGLLRKKVECRRLNLWKRVFIWTCCILTSSKALLTGTCCPGHITCDHGPPHTHTHTFVLLLLEILAVAGEQATALWTDPQQNHEIKHLRKECWKSIMAFISTASTPKYPAAWVPCCSLFSFPWTCPRRGGRIGCLHGRGHSLPTCSSVPAALAGPREHWIKTRWSHREPSLHIGEKSGTRRLLNVSLRLHCVQEECARFQNKERLCKRCQTLPNVLLVGGMGSRRVTSTREKRRNSVNSFHSSHTVPRLCM